ncbi:hypothetical protein GGTG_06838 [Gaeumannomyces tritici R3-111a-1]|uniref:Uncharacterized protein n=1 Tax=Gaeumannomyces tritici (strain R3-111a-1) TaxID=644352 RepID=J3NZZ1_GAET3|nr:hypothetical protein GGTG_06838 [Gaeumannomyces tritici R3-111a-1]EJT76924.1 hypothetical protein GGTG_06838 [Gaeumannomyces tritici R3-111a-1]
MRILQFNYVRKEGTVEVHVTTFKEWLLENAVLKSVMAEGVIVTRVLRPSTEGRKRGKAGGLEALGMGRQGASPTPPPRVT